MCSLLSAVISLEPLSVQYMHTITFMFNPTLLLLLCTEVSSLVINYKELHVGMIKGIWYGVGGRGYSILLVYIVVSLETCCYIMLVPLVQCNNNIV